MKPYVFMARSGNLLEAYRVTFTDGVDDDTIEVPDGEKKYSIGFLEHNGWIVTSPELNGGLCLFFNLKAENLFENLGEL